LILRSRLENVMAAGVSIVLLLLFLTTRLFRSIQLGPLSFVFVLLPVGILAVKSLLGLLASSQSGDDNQSTTRFLASFFRPLFKIVRDWFPFFLLCASYYSLYGNLILRVNPHVADSLLSEMDGWILGNQAAILLEPWIRPWLTDFLNAVYFSHLLFFPGITLYFYLVGEAVAFRRIMMGFLTIMLMGIATYLLIPAAGPEKFLTDHFTRDLHGQALSHSVNYIIDVGRVSYDCFPSLHVGIPLLLSFYLRNYRPKMFLPALLYVLLMAFATLYLRYHYFVDVLAAFLYAPAAYYLNDFLLCRWPGERISRASDKIKTTNLKPVL
jgi:membrane-associated phospholipid phosphatase